ncbi:MAG: methionyl-tRNA formyltransferase [Myxococcales bacterium]|nr:methionyl-tRNA formyltransferase [Myxococcales bacterium]
MFFGTPPIAVPALKALAETTELVGVVCQPDRPAGRGMKLTAPAVKQAALELGLEVHQPVKVKTGNLHEWLAERQVDVAVVLAYGRILPDAVLAAPRLGCINLHASLLPRYRGAAPINWAIMNGETESGISLMQMDSGLDTGAVYCTRALAIAAAETAGELAERMAATAAEMVREDLPRVVAGEIAAVPQDAERATHAPPLEKADLLVDWVWDAERIVNWVRGLSPNPCARTTLQGKTLKLQEARVCAADCPSGAPGEVVIADKSGLVIACGKGAIELTRGQLEGRKALGAVDLVNGRVLTLGAHLGT